MQKKKVAFLCIHNACRSQIAEALAKKFGSDVLDVYSAGTVETPLNSDAVRLIKQMYDIDMEKEQKSKLIGTIPPVESIITMGCNVICPVLPYPTEKEDWGIDDPTGKSDEEFIRTIHTIEQKVKNLIQEVKEEQLIKQSQQ